MSYTILIAKSVQKQMDKLPNSVSTRISEKIQRLEMVRQFCLRRIQVV